MKIKFSWQIVQKCSNVKFYDKQSIEGLDVECGETGRQTDRHEETSSRFS